jgi:hypothetical protein
MNNALTLSDILARRLNLQWYEGIAIVRSVAERLLEQSSVEPRIPELQQIELAADGSVTLAGGGSAKEPVRRLGQLLQALLNDAEVPVQLRLAVSQATAPIPSYASMAEFDQALAYFERPDRPATLKALYARALAAGPAATTDGSPTLDRIAPLPQLSGPTTLARSSPKNFRRLITAGLAFAGIVALATAGTLYVRSVGIPVNAGEVSRVTVAAADAVGAAVMTGVSAVSDRAGLGRLVSVDDDSPAPAKPVASPVPAGNGTKLIRRSAAVEPRPIPADDEGLSGSVIAYEIPTHLETAMAAPALERSTSDAVDDAAPQEVYTSASDGVTPPVNTRQQLPRTLPPLAELADLSRIEMVIAPDGSVESAKLLDARSDVLGGMFLSAVKAWEFYPAMKDGVAVRYRKLILVSFE